MSVSVKRLLGKAVTGIITASGNVVRALHFKQIAGITASPAFVAGRIKIMTLVAGVTARASVVVLPLSSVVNLVFRLGVPALRWVVSTAKTWWRVGP